MAGPPNFLGNPLFSNLFLLARLRSGVERSEAAVAATLIFRRISKQPSPEGEGFDGRLKSPKAGDRLRAGSFRDPKLVVLGLDTLRLDVLRDRFVSHIATRCDEVASGPEVSAPEFLPQTSKLCQQMVRCLPFYGLHHSTRRQSWWHAHQQVHMLPTHMTPLDFDVIAATVLSNQIPHPHRNISSQHRLAILRREHKMIVQQVDRV